MKAETLSKLLYEKEQLRNSYAKQDMAELGHKRIMAIDDCPDTLNVIYSFLKTQSKLVIETFENEEYAMHHFMRDNPDLVILDMNLSKLDGIKVAVILRNLSMFEVPILFISKDKKMKQEVERIYGDNVKFLAKPIHKNSLLEAVEDICMAS